MQKLFLITIFLSIIFFASCEQDEASPTVKSRSVKYTITGDYTSKFTVVATTNKDNFEVMEIDKLPWELSFEAKSSITTVIIQGTGTGGLSGQTATLKTFVGGKEVATGTGTALSIGVISITNASYNL